MRQWTKLLILGLAWPTWACAPEPGRTGLDDIRSGKADQHGAREDVDEIGGAPIHTAERAQHLLDHARERYELYAGTKRIRYNPAVASYLLFPFSARGGDEFTITASSPGGGDPVLWLLSRGTEGTPPKILSKSDDATDYDARARIHHWEPNEGPDYLLVVSEAYRLPATFDITILGIDPANPAELETFLALSDLEKMRFLFPHYNHQYRTEGEQWEQDLREGFRERPIELEDVTDTDVRHSLEAAHTALEAQSDDHDGTEAWVFEIRQGDVTYAFSMQVMDAAEDAEWQYRRIFDAKGVQIGEYGMLGYE